MPDREKVIEGQKQVILHLHRMSEVCYDGDVPYYEDLRDKAEDALELLNEQEPAEGMRMFDDDIDNCEWWYACGKCREPIDYKDQYCRHCGREVKWDD